MNKSKKIAILFLKIPGQLELGSKLGLRKYFYQSICILQVGFEFEHY